MATLVLCNPLVHNHAPELERQGTATPVRRHLHDGIAMGQLICQHMADVDGDSPIGGPDTHVEIDETLIGAMARSGDVVTAVVPNQRKVTLQPFVESKFATGGVVHTDELNSYRGLGAAGYRLACRDHERL